MCSTRPSPASRRSWAGRPRPLGSSPVAPAAVCETRPRLRPRAATRRSSRGSWRATRRGDLQALMELLDPDAVLPFDAPAVKAGAPSEARGAKAVAARPARGPCLSPAVGPRSTRTGCQQDVQGHASCPWREGVGVRRGRRAGHHRSGTAAPDHGKIHVADRPARASVAAGKILGFRCRPHFGRTCRSSRAWCRLPA